MSAASPPSKPDQPRHPHDAGYKLLFSHPEFVRDLIVGFVDDDWLAALDYSTLEQVPGDYVTEDFQQRCEDMVWRVQVELQNLSRKPPASSLSFGPA